MTTNAFDLERTKSVAPEPPSPAPIACRCGRPFHEWRCRVCQRRVTDLCEVCHFPQKHGMLLRDYHERRGLL